MGEPQVCEKTCLLDAPADPHVLQKGSCLALWGLRQAALPEEGGVVGWRAGAYKRWDSGVRGFLARSTFA